jgi:hypothetical protein
LARPGVLQRSLWDHAERSLTARVNR